MNADILWTLLHVELLIEAPIRLCSPDPKHLSAKPGFFYEEADPSFSELEDIDVIFWE